MNVSIKHRASNIVISYDLCHDLDLGFARSNFEIARSQEWEGWLILDKRDGWRSFMTMTDLLVTRVKCKDLSDSNRGDFVISLVWLEVIWLEVIRQWLLQCRSIYIALHGDFIVCIWMDRQADAWNYYNTRLQRWWPRVKMYLKIKSHSYILTHKSCSA